MNLVVDLGNSKAKYAVINDKGKTEFYLRNPKRFVTISCVKLTKKYKFKSAILSASSKAPDSLIKFMTGRYPPACRPEEREQDGLSKCLALIYSGVALVTSYLFLYDNNGILTTMMSNAFPGMNKNWFSGFSAVMFTMTFATTSNPVVEPW